MVPTALNLSPVSFHASQDFNHEKIWLDPVFSWPNKPSQCVSFFLGCQGVLSPTLFKKLNRFF
jgi:hypothetical protein